MGALRRVGEFFGLTFAAEPTPRPIDQIITEMMGAMGRVSRRRALSVPAVLKARNLICSTATLPLREYTSEWRTVDSVLLAQVDRDVANVVTFAQTIEDLFFDGISWWRITDRDGAGFPTHARHLDVTSVSLNPPNGRRPAPLPSGEDPREAVVWVDGKRTPARDVIRFDSPNPGLLSAVGRVVERAVALDDAARMYADNPRPQDYFAPAPGVAADPASDDRIRAFLAKWAKARRERSTAYVPFAFAYNTVDSPTPADLQLVELQRQVTLEIANATGIDPEDLGVSTTSRTYQNATDRRIDRINDTLSPYMAAVAQRLAMGDVTRVGNQVAWVLDDYLRADAKTRAEVDGLRLTQGTTTVSEIRTREHQPPIPASERPALAAAPAGNVVPMRRSLGAAGSALEAHADEGSTWVAFGADQAVTFPADTEGATFDVDPEARTIRGMVVPYNAIALRDGRRYRFAPGSLVAPDLRRVKLLRDHNRATAVGFTVSAVDTPHGLFAEWKVGRGPAGDEALALAADGVLDGLSPGVHIPPDGMRPDPENPGVILVTRSHWRETSLTAMPAFEDSRVLSVTATADGGNDMPETPAATVDPAAPPTTPAAPAPAADPTPVTFSADQVRAMVDDAITKLQAPGGPAFVDPTRRPAQVTEAQPYRLILDADFGQLARGSHDFSTDLFKGWDRNGNLRDVAAADRVNDFIRTGAAVMFDVATTDVNELNMPENRPNMYVDQREYRYPMWSAINKGTLTEITPFTFPKFSSASGLVGNHTEGAEPSSGTFVATNQTVTPTASSGKVKMTRETWDQGGNPQTSTLIWRQMVRAWFEALEAAAAALFTANAASITNIALTAGGGTTGQTAVAELKAALAALQFIRGGYAFTDAFTQIDLYLALSGSRDADGAPLIPTINPSNRDGQARARLASLDVAGTEFMPAWALAATGSVAASSFLFDRESCHGWASAPERIDIMNTEVAHIYIGLWGYKATAISDFTGTREIVYDPVA